jgi:uncharacterized membrane protein YdbT with pleckstrin-like domain
MNLVPDTDTVPYVVNRHLLSYEHQVITIHRHPAVLFWPIFVAGGGLIAAAVLSTLSALSGDALLLTWLLWGFALFYAAWKAADWFVSYYVVTSYRMMVVKGFLVRDVVMVPLATASDMRLRRSVLGRLIGYGQFIVETGGQHQDLRTISFLPYPEQLYLEVCGLLFRESPDEDEGDEMTGDSDAPPAEAEQSAGQVVPEHDSRGEDEKRRP